MTECYEDTVDTYTDAAANEIHIVDPCTSSEWMEFISSHPDAGIFHHPAWMTMLRDIYGYRMFAVCLKNGEKICAGIPFADVRSIITGRRWVSLPFSDYCAPLFSRENPQSMETLIHYLREQQETIIPKIEIRWRVCTEQKVHSANNFVLHTLALEADSEALFRRLDKQAVRNRVAKTQRGGVVVRECSSLDEFHDFYSLQLLTRKRLGVPAQPKYFFDAVWKYIIEPGLGYALVSYNDSTPIGGGVFLKFGSTVYYKYAAADWEYKNMHPNHAYIWEAMRRSCGEGYRVFDFGRSEVCNRGLRQFKAGWGTVEQPLWYTTIADHEPKVCSKSKLDIVTSFVIRNSPPVVCKLTGQLLYRHFA
jgi:CelD/BcsL family acetyltransferase involved in cellulose biosynthesis